MKLNVSVCVFCCVRRNDVADPVTVNHPSRSAVFVMSALYHELTAAKEAVDSGRLRDRLVYGRPM